MTISVLGAGTWGTAIALSLSHQQKIILWTRNQDTFDLINFQRKSNKFAHCRIPNNIVASISIEDVINTTVIIIAVPTQCLREICHQLNNHNIKQQVVIILTCKGIEQDTLKLPSEIVNEILPNNPIAIFSGPSFAIEVVKKLPYSMVLASIDDILLTSLASQLQQKNLALFLTSDVVGIQICAALKNVFAIACGIILGRNLGSNTHALLITKSMSEIMNLYIAKIGKLNIDTLMGPACLGDLMITCTSLNSRNLFFGMQIGKSKNDFEVQKIISERKLLIEGFSTAKSAYNLSKQLQIKIPICEAIYRLLYKNYIINDILEILIN
ncbi:NAD(P)H-dependent glycerol-3-phosphate dehydrogenase [Wolbachia endosymbiont of Howardula sp.]|uniref:NAD(P)H-dependent glycerol-3-phosphate dehydrogenase n=1 Tax=Wolbachia endosymbiont of Howardula sp. TaxID=2916816 RepID=UPI00217E6B5F|nr:NAD(P)H-dependent glycerol-3-phosphate dehydrogenase [Wolbachia endosymbiont of Howardula sp.]UWI82953.1 NAD(P)H-dependent glycerol-3-phosphate dehydrogenase [Wolbachia endosymbiont of Howardula sp.]